MENRGFVLAVVLVLGAAMFAGMFDYGTTGQGIQVDGGPQGANRQNPGSIGASSQSGPSFSCADSTGPLICRTATVGNDLYECVCGPCGTWTQIEICPPSLNCYGANYPCSQTSVPITPGNMCSEAEGMAVGLANKGRDCPDDCQQEMVITNPPPPPNGCTVCAQKVCSEIAMQDE